MRNILEERAAADTSRIEEIEDEESDGGETLLRERKTDAEESGNVRERTPKPEEHAEESGGGGGANVE